MNITKWQNKREIVCFQCRNKKRNSETRKETKYCFGRKKTVRITAVP